MQTAETHLNYKTLKPFANLVIFLHLISHHDLNLFSGKRLNTMLELLYLIEQKMFATHTFPIFGN